MNDILLPILIGICIWAAIGGFACLCYAVLAGRLRREEADDEDEEI